METGTIIVAVIGTVTTFGAAIIGGLFARRRVGAEAARAHAESTKALAEAAELRERVDQMEWQRVHDELARLTRKLDDKRNRVEKLEGELAIEREHRRQLEEEMRSMRQAINERDQRIRELEVTEKRQSRRITELTTTVNELRQELAEERRQRVEGLDTGGTDAG